MEKRFYRKMNDKILGGVCSGLAEYIGMDKSVVRLLALVAIMATGILPGLFVYFLCVLIVPYDVQAYQSPHFDSQGQDRGYYGEDHYEHEYRESWNTDSSRKLIGALLIAAGVFLLARMFFDWLSWRYLFAGLLIVGGLYILFGRK